MPFFAPGTPRIALMAANGLTRALTLYLPPPDRKDGVTLEWIEKSKVKTLIDGSEAAIVSAMVAIAAMVAAPVSRMSRRPTCHPWLWKARDVRCR